MVRLARPPLWSLVFIALAASASLAYALVGTSLITSIINSQAGQPDYAITASPTSQGASQGFTSVRVTVTGTRGFTGTVSLSTTVLQTGSNVPSATISPASITFSGNSIGTANLTINTANVVLNANTGYPTFNVTVTGSSGRLSHSTSVSVTMLNPQRCTPGFICPSFTDPLFISVSQNTTTWQISSIEVNNNAKYQIDLHSYYYTDSYKVQVGSENVVNTVLGANSLTLFSSAQLGVQVYGIVLLWQAPPPPPTITSQSLLNQSWTPVNRPLVEALGFEPYQFNTGTNVTISIRNTGVVPVTLTSYVARDPSGDQYALTSWNEPTIEPTMLVKVNILIGASCPSCVLTGSAFTFSWPDPVTLVTSRGSQFTTDV